MRSLLFKINKLSTKKKASFFITIGISFYISIYFLERYDYFPVYDTYKCYGLHDFTHEKNNIKQNDPEKKYELVTVKKWFGGLFYGLNNFSLSECSFDKFYIECELNNSDAGIDRKEDFSLVNLRYHSIARDELGAKESKVKITTLFISESCVKIDR